MDYELFYQLDREIMTFVKYGDNITEDEYIQRFIKIHSNFTCYQMTIWCYVIEGLFDMARSYYKYIENMEGIYD